MMKINTPPVQQEHLPIYIAAFSGICFLIFLVSLFIPSLANLPVGSSWILDAGLPLSMFASALLVAPTFLFVYRKVLTPIFSMAWATLALAVLLSSNILTLAFHCGRGFTNFTTCSTTVSSLIAFASPVNRLLVIAGIILAFRVVMVASNLKVLRSNKFLYLLSLVLYALIGLFSLLITIN